MASLLFFFFFFNDTATTEIYPLSLHDALPILVHEHVAAVERLEHATVAGEGIARCERWVRSEEHTSELQSPCNLVCRLLLEKKKQNYNLHQRRSIRCHRSTEHYGTHHRDQDLT